MRDKRIGILAIQETHLDTETLNSLQKQFQRLEIHNSSNVENPKGKGGVALVMNKNIVLWRTAVSKEIIPGRAILTTLYWQKASKITVLSIYAPNDRHKNAAFWTELQTKWNNERLNIPDIVMGDMNLTEEAIDRLPAHPDNTPAVDRLQDFKSLLGLKDGWRARNPATLMYTFVQSTTTPSRSRIDRIYTSEQVYNNSRSWTIEDSGIDTDHRMASMEYANPASPYIGKGQWQIPLYLLENRQVMKAIRQLGKAAEEEICALPPLGNQEPTTKGPQKIFAELKTKVTTFVREFSRTESPKLDMKIKRLKEHLQIILNTADLLDDEVQMNIFLTEEHIRQLASTKHTQTRENVATRARIESETIGKYWVRSNKTLKPRDTLSRLRDPKSPMETPRYITRSDEMAETARDYHEDLQKTGIPANNNAAEQAEVLNHIKTKVSPREKTALAKYLKEDEVSCALSNLPKGKAPGIDGIPNELWLKLHLNYEQSAHRRDVPVNIVKILTAVYNDIEKNGVDTSTGFATGWLCPIYKKGDEEEISNYRPITVLNADYKVMTKALTNRLTTIVPNLIHPDQAGFMTGRRIEDQTELIKLMIRFCEVREENGIIVCLDQEKAYDKIRHDFIWQTLTRMNMPDHFINTVKTLYNHGETLVVINGVLSSPYRVTRGVRQGDPLSCLIFNLAIESLASMLRDSDLKGFQLPGDQP